MTQAVPGSFRDPSGFLFTSGGVLYRQVDRSYAENYDLLMSSGLYEELTGAGLLVPHEEVDVSLAASGGAYKVLKPERVDFVSYPYEWAPGMLRDAALLTLDVQKRAIDKGLWLHDASAYNVQFQRGRPVLIDTLSFEKLREGEPWIGYRQFCQHFLAPLALSTLVDVRLGFLSRQHIDGVPLDLASTLLGRKGRRPSLLMHIRAHARAQAKHADRTDRPTTRKFTERALRGLMASLESAVRKLEWKPESDTWLDYYDTSEHYTDVAHDHKKMLVTKLLEETNPSTVWDLGGNTGMFARLAAARSARTVCFDVDPACVEANYRKVVADKESHLLPLVCDLTNPSPGLGWEGRERMSVAERGPADVALALAVIHHLAIGNNVPLDRVARYFADLCTALVIEFVPKTDPMVRKLLATRDDIFPSYTQDGFEAAFAEHFALERREQIVETERQLYLFRRRP